ncbi:XRE family transcriptional regulator [Flavobacterium sp. LC2016-23]|uniref:XRE family transcriptional regulator n=1 Tax=Flavobacterium sp. LC2016-23 TaxID=2666330 RepID=UPI0012AFCFF3|nr:XRE family transcriptional regulator [Flavobacterium sp. LC2016-23]MRX40371.1 XRE family transcriptional regulator [Flavobacterium sp. LC2016-23]
MDKNISLIKERILQYAEFKGLGKEKFITELGMTYGNFKGTQKKTSVNSDFLDKLLSAYPEINIEWLLSGVGSIEKESSLHTPNEDRDFLMKILPKLGDEIHNEAKLFDDSQEPEILINSNGNKYFVYPDGTIRIEVIKIPFHAYASYVECYNDEVVLKEEFSTITFKVDHIGRGNYVGFESVGESMWNGGGYDTPSGADMLGREVGKHLWCNGFHNTKYGFVVISKEGIWHKDIQCLNDDGSITLTSRNPLSKPFNYPLNDILQVFHVIKRSF